jgi:Fe-S-cluster-containing dehydrogenase component
MDKWNLIVDVPLCENCNNCVLATKDELVANNFPGYSAPHAAHGPGVIRIHRMVRGQAPMVDTAYLPRLCNHCDDAPCVRAAGGAIYKRKDGIVIIDPITAKGRRVLVDACPYGAIVWNEEQQLPQNWFFDAHLLDAGWKTPRCVGVCPTAAIEAVKISDDAMKKRVDQEQLRSLNPEWGTRPRVYYRHLGRFDRCFIGGSAVVVAQGRSECLEGADVELKQSGGIVARTRSDVFGDFKFDGLANNSGQYEITAHHPRHGRVHLSVTLGDQSLYLGEIRLTSDSQYPRLTTPT